MSYTVCNVLDLGEAYTGATLNAQLYDSSNSTVGSAITTGFYERSGAKGIYAFTLSVPDAHQGWCDIYVSGASSNVLATIPINPAELENADVKTSTRSTFAGGAVASVTGNVGGNVTGSVGSVTSGVTVTTNNDKTGYALSSAAIQAIWDALTSALTTVGSIGKLLVTNIDAVVSSRLATSGYTVPPTVAAIRTEMDSNSTKLANLDATISSRAPSSTALSMTQWTNTRAANLDNLDAAVSTRLPTSSYTAPTTPPTVTAIRQEMDTNSTKLANLDATVSSRLATSGYTTPPTVAAIRSEIDSNSTKLDATVSSRASQSSLNALNNLSQAQAQSAAAAALAAYSAATATNVSSAQTAITTAISALNDITAADVVAALMAYAVESGIDLSTVLKELYAILHGKYVANAADPTSIDFYAPDGTTVRVTHTLTDTIRTPS